MLNKWLISFGLLCASTVMATDTVWIVGGGSEPDSSQAQIEKNVIWAADVISASVSDKTGYQIKIFFTDGNNPGKDVKVWRPVDTAKSSLQPLAMIYNAVYDNGLEYRNHEINNVIASTRRSVLEPILREDFAAMQKGDQGLFIFNGHGSLDRVNTANNKIWLWDRSFLNVTDFSNMLNAVDKQVPMRFVFTQCYSGAFERLVHPNAADTNDLVDASRCGFFAEAADRKAEGCSASVDTADYRDYSTYFFAALGGKTRQGKPLSANPDRNNDGQVSLYEAHLYSLAQADSTDLPRSTSEVYLERWQPWYLRWFFAGEGHGNVYAKLANDLARTLRVPTDQAVQRSVISKMRRRLDRRDKKLVKERADIVAAMKQIRFTIRYQLEQRWPALAKRRLEKGQLLNVQEIATINKQITGHDDWPALLAGLKRYQDIADERLAIEREMTRFDKLKRLNKLARLRQQFEQHASAEQRAAYQQLLECERLPL